MISAEAVTSSQGDVHKPHSASEYRWALFTVGAGVACAGVFGGTVVRHFRGVEGMHAWFTCYLLEQSLSLDNLFAFYALFKYFGVPPHARQRVLLYGYVGAMVFSGAVILTLGTTMRYLSPLLVLFVPVLFYQAHATWNDDEDEGEDAGLADNRVVQVARWLLPEGRMTAELHGPAFVVRDNATGQWRFTPLLLCLLCIEFSDIVFSADSVPAILAVTPDAFILYTSNLATLACMRSMYVLVATAVSDLPDLRRAVALLLAFIGAKLGLEALASTAWIPALVDFEVSNHVTLGTVASVLALGLLSAAARHLVGRGGTQSGEKGTAVSQDSFADGHDEGLYPLDEAGPSDMELAKLLEDTLTRRGSHRTSPNGCDEPDRRPRATSAPHMRV